MMSRRSDQKSLFQADVQYLGFVGRESFYGFLAQYGRELFPDEDFLELYCPDTGRPSVAPSLLAFLTGLIEDGQRALAVAREVRSGLEEGSEEDEEIAKAAELLSQLLWQDVEPRERGYGIRHGTGRDRVPSVEDPEQRR